MRAILEHITNTIFPSSCKECGKLIPTTQVLCAECITSITFLPKPLVAYFPLRSVATRPIFYQAAEISIKPAVPLYYPPVEIHSAISYEGVAKKLVSQLKYFGQLEIAKIMGDWIDRLHHKALSDHDLIIPIPLHRWRFMSRGFNQAAELAKALSKRSQLPFRPDLLTRLHYTPAQTRFKKRERFKNIKNAFSVTRTAAEQIHKKRLVLVDDVYTTGATTQAACTELFKYKPQKVTIVTFARTPLY